MKIKFLYEAFQELNDAIAYYEDHQSGLGLKLKEEIDMHIDWILRNHSVPRVRKGGYRRINLKVFPYYIAYITREQILWILAIAHGHRKPEYWVNRKHAIPSQFRSG